MNAKVKAALEALRKIDGEKAGTGKKYVHAYPYYAQLYGKSERTIVRWANEGKPLDDPKAMAELLSPRGRKPDEPAERDELPAGDDLDETSPVKLDEGFFVGAGVLAAVDRLEKAERERAAAYFKAISRRQPTVVVQNRFKEWMGIVEALRKLALDVPGIRKANELTVDKRDIEASVGTVFAAFRGAARNLPTRAAAKLLAARTREEFVEILEGEIEVLLRTLTGIAAAAVGAEADRAPADTLEAGTEPAPALPPADPTPTKKPRTKTKTAKPRGKGKLC